MEWIHDPVLASRMTGEVCSGLEEAYFKKRGGEKKTQKARPSLKANTSEEAEMNKSN